MAKYNTLTMGCDRCGAEQEIVRSEQHYGWGEIKARQVNGPFRIATADDKQSKDVCPGCLKSLEQWWISGRASKSDQSA